MGSKPSRTEVIPPWKINISNLKFHETIGEGGEATVYRVTFKIPHGGFREAAAKVVRVFDEREVNILRKLRHKNIVSLLGFYQKAPNNIIVLEFAPNGSLCNYLLKHRSTPLPPDLFQKWVKESALAVQYLHGKNIIHRDIKPQNCLLFHDNTLKLSDFGLAKEISLDKSQTSSDIRGTYHYMAPEIITGRDDGRANYSLYADMYAYGTLVLVMHTRTSPYEGQEGLFVAFKVGKGELQPAIPADFPAELSDVMNRCWEFEPKNRPHIDQVVEVVSQMEKNNETDTPNERYNRILLNLCAGVLCVIVLFLSKPFEDFLTFLVAQIV